MSPAVVRLNALVVAWRVIPLLALLALGVMYVVLLFDREPPYRVLSQEPAVGAPGEAIEIRLLVQRDKNKRCDVRGTRLLIDAEGVPHTLSPFEASREQIVQIEQRTPGRSAIPLVIPESAAPGVAAVVSTRDYVCNKAHQAWPIRYTSTQTVTVLKL